ncbi:MAG TPA: hypothetical protein VGD08_25300 [Stellaceae bacterium]|jgi:hypothetical protein
MNRGWRLFTSLIACAALIGCETNAVPISYYNVPQETPDAPNAKIGGTKTFVLLGPDTRTYAGAIDGKVIRREREADYDQSVPISPGVHALSIDYRDGSWHASVPIRLDARPGATYVVKAERVNQISTTVKVTLWVEDAGDGTLVADKTVVPVIPSGGTTFMFLPVKR